MDYLDTSLLVAALTQETSTGRAQRWLASRGTGTLAISDWGVTEFSAALSMKVRLQVLLPEHRARILGAFTRLCSASLELWPLTRADYRTAARYADEYTTGLRAGDALHLAVAAGRGATVRTLDREMIAAARALGVIAAGFD